MNVGVTQWLTEWSSRHWSSVSYRLSTQRQRPSAQEQGLGQGPGPASPPADETFGQAPPRAQSRNPAAAQQSGSCWIPTNEDFGVGYWGPCSNKGSRPVK